MIDREFWRGRRVLLTGHTGFKGGWLAVWLRMLGAQVTGYALAPPTEPSFFDTNAVADALRDVRGDIRDADAVRRVVEDCRPQVVFHLAARSIVREGYREPLEFYSTNVVGTATVLEACRAIDDVAVVCVTTDKCYENREWVWPYREDDALGGRDPYSSSKAAAELVAAAYRRSFYLAEGSRRGLATARAGNVVGGGDWAADRLLPDLARSFRDGKPLTIRNPTATRPWQHVLEPLSGYLVLAQHLAQDAARHSQAWNFGPDAGADQPVLRVAQEAARFLGGAPAIRVEPDGGPHEAGRLALDSSKARSLLGWKPRLHWTDALRLTVEWYERFGRDSSSIRAFTERQIEDYQAA